VDKSQLTAKQRRFVQEFCVDLNAHQAAVRAGYSKKTARQIGSENLSKPDILKAIKAEMRMTEESIGITKESVIKSLIDIRDRCMQSVPILDTSGKPTGEYRFNATGATRAVELLGKSIGLFNQKFSVDVKEPVTIQSPVSPEVQRVIDEICSGGPINTRSDRDANESNSG
jgi:phage terminase small subunit